MNVVSLGKFKELKEVKRVEESYGYYLKTLCNSQLETEVNTLIEEFSTQNYGNDYSSKSQLILNEITSRVDLPVKPKIKELSKNLFN
jgi:hypothetical protein